MQSSKEPPPRNTLITTEATDASGDSRMRIDHGALRRVLLQKEVRDKPIALISIAGCMRTGKSFLMNFILRYFREKGWENSNWIGDADTCVNANDIPWKGGTQRVTTGLRIFNEIFEVPWKDQTMKVMIMDTQGLFDFKTPEVMNKAMLTLTTLLSSVQIFNAIQPINTQNLDYLKTCVDFALEAASSKQSRNYLRLQRLIFLLRDFPDQEDEIDTYTLEYGKKHLATILDSNHGGWELNSIRQGIRKSFQEVDCFPLPHPGPKATKVTFKGSNKDLDEQFLHSVKLFVEEIASPSKLTPKCSDRKWLTARELLNMIAACDTNFYNNRFAPKVMIEANERAYYAAEYEEAIGQYIGQMKNHVGSGYIDDEKLSVCEQEARQQAIRRYDTDRKMGSDRPHRMAYEKHLIDKCDEYFRYLKEQLKSDQTMRAAMNAESIREALVWYEKEMQTDEELNEEELKNRHTEKYNKVISKYKGVTDIDKLQRKIKEKYERLRMRQKDNAKERGQKKARENELFSLITVKLKTLCSDKWGEIVTTYQNEASMERAKQEIEQETREQYWNLALTPTEKKHLIDLENRLKAKYDSSKSNLDLCKEDLVQAQFIDYFTSCCEHLPTYFRRLDGVLQSCYKEACQNNEEIWESVTATIRLTVDRLTLEHERELQEAMVDRHINDEQIKSHYDRTIEDLLQRTPEELSNVFQQSERAKEFFKEDLKNKMSVSLTGILERSQQDKKNRLVIETPVPRKPGGFLRKLKKFFGFSG